MTYRIKKIKKCKEVISFLLLFILAITLSLHSKAQKSYIPGVVTGLPASLSPSNARILNGDFDGDGDPDLLYQAGNVSGLGISYLRNNGNSSFTRFDANASGIFTSGTPFNGILFNLIVNPDRATTGQPIGQRVFDYDGDNDQDIFEISTAGTARILLQNAGVFSAGILSSAFPVTLAGSVSRWVNGDIDSDGDQDILYQSGNASGLGIHLIRNNGGGSWTDFTADASGLFSDGPLSGISFSRIGNNTNFFQFVFDADGDADNDLYELSPSGYRYFARSGTSFTSAPLPSGLLTSLSPAVFRIVPADFDHEGDIDFIYQSGNTSGNNISYLRNNRNGTFTKTDAVSGVFSGPNTPFGSAAFTFISRAGLNGEQIVMDLDGDADLDILQLSTTSSSVLLQTGFNLPVKLVAYSIAKSGTGVIISWKTAEEINVSHFSVEYSRDGRNFVSLDKISTKGGTGAEYAYLHRTPVVGWQFYRLIEVDVDGEKYIFPIKTIQFDGIKKLIQIVPAMVNRSVTAYFVQSSFSQVILVDNSGRALQSVNISGQQSRVDFNLSGYASGLYYLRFIGNDGVVTERVMKK